MIEAGFAELNVKMNSDQAKSTKIKILVAVKIWKEKKNG